MNKDWVISRLVSDLDDISATRITELSRLSRSPYCQDIFALSRRPMTQGYFVEFGATDGLSWSNSWLLEAECQWNGLLAEPARIWHHALRSNRRAIIDTRCVYSKTGLEIDFLETSSSTDEFPLSSAELSGIETHADNGDWASLIRLKNSTRYKVTTVTLTDLLVEHAAPKIIDYLSIDTEGSEYDCLLGLDFNAFTPLVITIEHNRNNVAQQKYLDLLSSKNYLRLFPELSGDLTRYFWSM